MHRLLVDGSALAEDRPALGRECAAHLRAVRPQDGEAVELFDGAGAVRTYRWSSRDRALVADGAARRVPRRGGRGLVLFACVTKGARWDWTVQKATELGVTRIVPVLSERTIVRVAPGEREAKRGRWERIAAEAARQSDAAYLPRIDAPTPFADAVAMAREAECFAGVLSDPPPPPLLEALSRSRRDDPRDLAMFTGPEGDFSPGELAALAEAAVPASFGPTVLRAETAAIFGVSVLAAWLGR